MEHYMTDAEQPGTDLDKLVQKLDDIDAELEIQSDYLGKIKMLLTWLVILMVPVVLLVLDGLYTLLFPHYYF